MNSITKIVLFLVMTLLTGGLIVEHSRLAVIPFIIALISGIALIVEKINEDKLPKRIKRIINDEHGKFNSGSSIVIVIVILVSLFILMIATLLGSYRIDTGQGAIVTEVSGNKHAEINVGWHTRTPFLTDVEKYSIVKNNLYFPADYLELENKFQGDTQAGAIGFDIKTTDDNVVDTGALMTFEITDLIQFGVKNTRPVEQLQKSFDATVFNYLQSQSSERITTQIMAVNKELLVQLKDSGMEEQYGIKIDSVSLLRPTFTKIALDALAEKKAIQTRSEGELIAAKNRAEAIETIAKAQKKQSEILKDVPQEQLDFNAKLTLYDTLKENKNVIWVIPSGQPLVLSK